MQIFLSTIGMVFLIASPFWAWMTTSGGWLMAFLGAIFILIARDLEYEDTAEDAAEQLQRLKDLKRRRLKEAMAMPTPEEFARKHANEVYGKSESDTIEEQPQPRQRSPEEST